MKSIHIIALSLVAITSLFAQDPKIDSSYVSLQELHATIVVNLRKYEADSKALVSLLKATHSDSLSKEDRAKMATKIGEFSAQLEATQKTLGDNFTKFNSTLASEMKQKSE